MQVPKRPSRAVMRMGQVERETDSNREVEGWFEQADLDLPEDDRVSSETANTRNDVPKPEDREPLMRRRSRAV